MGLHWSSIGSTHHIYRVVDVLKLHWQRTLGLQVILRWNVSNVRLEVTSWISLSHLLSPLTVTLSSRVVVWVSLTPFSQIDLPFVSVSSPHLCLMDYHDNQVITTATSASLDNHQQTHFSSTETNHLIWLSKNSLSACCLTQEHRCSDIAATCKEREQGPNQLL